MGNICERAQQQPIEFDSTQFKQKNLYFPMPSNRSILAVKNLLDPQDKIKQINLKQIDNLCLYIANKQKFKDPNFEIKSTHTAKVCQIYNFERQNINDVFLDRDTRYDCFEEEDLQFTYLAVVFYQVCRNKGLKQDIFLTRQMKNNPYNAYLINLFCNGQKTWVVVDDNIPVQNSQNPININVTRGRQLWPYLLQKAWCKQLGSYQKARGLSPQDAFQQITGIPAYSYFIKDIDPSVLAHKLQQHIQDGYWICLTGTTQHQGIKNRQVFLLQDVKKIAVQRGNQQLKIHQFYVRSPYLNYSLKNHKKNQNKCIGLNINQLTSTFQYITIGYVMKDYNLQTYKHKSNKRQDRFYQLKLNQQDTVSIRFIQFYAQYLNFNNPFPYSPVFMQLYDDKHQLMYQGCPKSTIGNRSSHLTDQVLLKLNPGFYYLRVQVDWMVAQYLNEGNIVIYGKQTKLIQTGAQYKDLVSIINSKLLNSSRVQEQLNKQQNLVVKTYEKQYGYLVQIQNNNKTDVKIIVDLSKSKNIRLRGQQLPQDKKLKLMIQKRASFIMEILPQNPAQQIQLVPIQITKL